MVAAMMKKKTVNLKEKRIIATRQMIEEFVTKEMMMTNEEWEEYELEKIFTIKKKNRKNEASEFIYIVFKIPEDANRFKSKLGDLSQETNNLVSNYIEKDCIERINAIDNIAWQYRRKDVRTKIYMGQHDFLLLTKSKNDVRPWSQIPPMLIKEGLPDFTFGILSEEDKDI